MFELIGLKPHKYFLVFRNYFNYVLKMTEPSGDRSKTGDSDVQSFLAVSFWFFYDNDPVISSERS